MDYSRNPGLQSVVLYLRRPLIFTSLTQLSSSDVRKITFHFPYLQNITPAQSADYQTLDQRLTPGDFPRLQNVVFKCDVYLPLHAVKAKLRRIFRALASSGMISAEVPEKTREHPSSLCCIHSLFKTCPL